MIRKIKMLISLCLVFSFCLLGSLSVNAADVTPSVDEVFPEEQVEALQEKVSNLPVCSDKDENGEFHNITTRATGSYPTRKGVILVTDDKYKGIVPTGHAAIIYSASRVVESLENGVVTGANNWNTSKSTCYGVTVKGTTTSQDAAAADWCYNQLKKPYNWSWLDKDRRDAFYCSHLVYAAFIDKYDINIDTDAFLTAIHPSEIVDSSNTTIIYKK